MENIFDRMNFEDTKEAYRLKNNNELYRAFYLYRLIANNTLVALGSKLALWALQLGLPISGLFKHTVFKQFCAGAAKEDSIKLVHRLADLNVKSYMHFAAENSSTEPTKSTTKQSFLLSWIRVPLPTN